MPQQMWFFSKVNFLEFSECDKTKKLPLKKRRWCKWQFSEKILTFGAWWVKTCPNSEGPSKWAEVFVVSGFPEDRPKLRILNNFRGTSSSITHQKYKSISDIGKKSKMTHGVCSFLVQENWSSLERCRWRWESGRSKSQWSRIRGF